MIFFFQTDLVIRVLNQTLQGNQVAAVDLQSNGETRNSSTRVKLCVLGLAIKVSFSLPLSIFMIINVKHHFLLYPGERGGGMGRAGEGEKKSVCHTHSHFPHLTRCVSPYYNTATHF